MFDIAQKMTEDRYFAINWANKVENKLEMSEVDTEMSNEIDAWAKKIGKGLLPIFELSAYLTKVVEPIYADAPFELLNMFFDFNTFGEFENYEEIENAKNTLQAYESARAVGNVDRHFLDYAGSATTWRHIQLETGVTLEKLRKGGYKTVAELTAFAEAAIRNKIFALVMSAVGAAVVGGDNYGTGVLSKTTVDTMVDYMNELTNSGLLLATSTNVNIMNKLVDVTYMSDAMKEEFNRTGSLPVYRGVAFKGIPKSAALADGSMPIASNVVYGVCGKVGAINYRGEMRVSSKQDDNAETIHLKFTGIEFGINITEPENLFKHVIA